MSIQKFNVRGKPKVIAEAMQFNGWNYEEVETFCGGDSYLDGFDIIVATKDGPLRIRRGEYVVRDSLDIFYSLPAERFFLIYERGNEE